MKILTGNSYGYAGKSVTGRHSSEFDVKLMVNAIWHNPNGQPTYSFITRLDVRRAFDCPYTIGIGSAGQGWHMRFTKRTGRLKIGCCMLSRKNTEIVRRWARKKSR